MIASAAYRRVPLDWAFGKKGPGLMETSMSMVMSIVGSKSGGITVLRPGKLYTLNPPGDFNQPARTRTKTVS